VYACTNVSVREACSAVYACMPMQRAGGMQCHVRMHVAMQRAEGISVG
jgi:hypothetical protein